ncbi:MAG: heavy-metal-associated domain-containing protein [Actinomycetota bacterium]|nr:heavy-metal-associated domain-containing protein [Actinomycetota bacterium]
MGELSYTVKGIHCQSCVANISENVGEVAGVSAVDVSLEEEKVVVRGDEVDDAAVRAAIAAAGYQAA